MENYCGCFFLKGPPLGFGEICVDFWDFERGVPEPPFLLLLMCEKEDLIEYIEYLRKMDALEELQNRIVEQIPYLV